MGGNGVVGCLGSLSPLPWEVKPQAVIGQCAWHWQTALVGERSTRRSPIPNTGRKMIRNLTNPDIQGLY